jgi:hypothetical protein
MTVPSPLQSLVLVRMVQTAPAVEGGEGASRAPERVRAAAD